MGKTDCTRLPTMLSHRVTQPPLANLVSLFWLAEDYAPPHRQERVLPTGTVELVVDLTTPAIVVSGARSQYFVLDTSRPFSVLGIHFQPGGAFPFLDIPAGELCNAAVPLEALWGPAANDLRDRLLEASTPPARFELLARSLLARAAQPPAR